MINITHESYLIQTFRVYLNEITSEKTELIAKQANKRQLSENIMQPSAITLGSCILDLTSSTHCIHDE